MVEHQNITYHGKQKALLNVQADAAYIPFADASFDAVICSELLEHVFQPIQVVEEAYRVLRPDGVLLLCVPFLYRIHADPYDYGRYTDYYWQRVLQETGFCRITVERQGLFFSVLLDFPAIPVRGGPTTPLWPVSALDTAGLAPPGGAL